jgi:hypothetical protein
LLLRTFSPDKDLAARLFLQALLVQTFGANQHADIVDASGLRDVDLLFNFRRVLQRAQNLRVKVLQHLRVLIDQLGLQGWVKDFGLAMHLNLVSNKYLLCFSNSASSMSLNTFLCFRTTGLRPGMKMNSSFAAARSQLTSSSTPPSSTVGMRSSRAVEPARGRPESLSTKWRRGYFASSYRFGDRELSRCFLYECFPPR